MNYPKLPSFRLDGKRALITGAGRGIGMGASIALAESGADVTLVSRTETELKDLTKHINNQGYQSFYEVLDVSDEDEVSKFINNNIIQVRKQNRKYYNSFTSQPRFLLRYL